MIAALLVVAAATAAPRAPSAAEGAAAHTPPRVAAPASARAPAGRVLAFDEAFHLDADVVLRGATARLDLPLTRPTWWTLAGDPVLTLRYAHAPGLDPGRSRLAVHLDDRVLVEVPLEGAAAAEAVLTVPLPAHALGDHARLTVTTTHHRQGGCDGPFEPDLWTRISAASTLLLPGAPAPVAATLPALRSPLLDPLGYGPLRVTPVLTGPAPVATLDALAELALSLGRLAEWRGVEVNVPVSQLAEATGPALAIGLATDLPADVRPLLPLAELTGDQGLVALLPNPADPTLPVLVVTGRTPAGLRSAARAVAREDRVAWLSGAVTVVTDVPDAPPPPPVRRPRPFGDRARATLAELGHADVTVRGLYAAPVAIPVELEGDAAARPDGASVTVRYAYGAGLDPALSTVEVRYGGVGLGSAPLDEADGDPDARFTVALPSRLVTPHAQLEVLFHLLPTSWERCTGTPADHLWATLSAETELRFDRDHVARLPDLARLRHRWFPFGGEDGRPLTVLLGERAEPVDVAAALQVVATVAARSFAADPVASIVAGRPTAPGPRVLLVRDDQPHVGARALGLPRVAVAGRPTVEARQAGPDPVLVLAAADGPALLGLARDLGRDAVLGGLEGSRAVVDPSGEVSVVARDEGRRVWRTTGLARARAELRERLPLLLLGLAPGALMFAVALRAWARRRGAEVG